MLLEGAIGDAYGTGFEFADRSKIAYQNTVSRYERHPLFEEIHKRYTDDTQMAIALAELIIEEVEWTEQMIANKFVETFRRDPRRGYSKGFYRLLSEVTSGEELLAKIHPKSDRNGAAMRAYPLGIIRNENELLEQNRMQAIVTHQSENAVHAAQAIALTAHFYLYRKGGRTDLLTYLSDVQGYVWQANWSAEVQVDAIQTVEAVLTVLLNEHSLKQMLKKSVDFGGDVDTVASLALALGSLDIAVEQDLPLWLMEELEQGRYGRDYLSKLDQQLMARLLV